MQACRLDNCRKKSILNLRFTKQCIAIYDVLGCVLRCFAVRLLSYCTALLQFIVLIPPTGIFIIKYNPLAKFIDKELHKIKHKCEVNIVFVGNNVRLHLIVYVNIIKKNNLHHVFLIKLNSRFFHI